MNHDIKDIALADEGLARILWADRDMPVLASIRERFEREKPLDGVRIGACMHVTTETANLMRALSASGAKVTLCASNPLSTQDDTAASLVRDFGIDVFAIAGEDADTYNRHIEAVIACDPQIVMDDGADLDTALHTKFTDKLAHVVGGTEETTTGVVRLMSMAAEGTLAYPVFNINDANTKHCFDNHYGTGQSTLDGIVRATNRLLCGRTIVISGYGYCGSGLALRAKGMGMRVIVCEVDPLKALEAHMEGYEVMPAAEAARFADVWVTVTGNCKVVDGPAFENMKDGAIVCNSGHFDSEINLEWLEDHATKKEEIKPLVEEYTLPDGRHGDRAGAGPPREPVVRRGSPRVRDGHELREPGAGRRVPVPPRRRAGEQGVRRARRHRRRRGAREAGDAGHRDRHAHRGADQVHELLELRDAVGSDEGSPFPAGKEPGA